MKKIIFITLFLSSIIAGQAQNGNGGTMGGGNLQSLKIAYLTRQLNLTTEEAQKFWPVYYAYVDELKAVRQQNKDNVLVFEEKALAVKKKYQADFRKILQTDQRVNKVYSAESDFVNQVKKVLMKRQEMRGMRKNDPSAKQPPTTEENN